MKEASNISEQLSSFPFEIVFPDILWIIFWVVVILLTKDFIKTAITTLLNRLKHGAGVKIGSFELQGLKVTENTDIKNSNYETTIDENDERYNARKAFFEKQRGVMPVNKIYKSQKNGQLYDILIYLIPHKGHNLIQVTSVEYYFGKNWGRKIFKTEDRSNGFAIVTSAYGAFLCSIKINFNDGTDILVYKYIDFEMGDVAAIAKSSEE